MYVSPGPAPGYQPPVRGPLHPYQGFRPVQTGAASWSGYQGELSPELRDRQLELLERRYQGARLPVHRAAAIIQTAWREHVLRTKFRRMVELAKSVENMSVAVTRLSGEAGDSVRSAASAEGAAARHIQSRRHMRRQQGGRMIQRSTSLRDHRRSGSWSGGVEILEGADHETREATEVRSGGSNRLKPSNSWTETRTLRTAADLQNKLNSARDLSTRDVSPTCSPVPPCPPLRGRDFYPDQEPLYTCIPGPTRGPLARDSVYCSVRRPRRMPPRVPQRTVSFLGQESGHATHVSPPSQHVSPDPRELAPHQRPISISESNLPRDPARHVSLSTSAMARHVSHSRSQSSPCHSKVSPLPPPPYVPPPSVHHRDPNEPLPPPPELDPGLPGPPSDSVSSIDSGFRSSCSDSASSGGEASSPHSPCQPYPDPGPETEAGAALYQAQSPQMVIHPEDPYSYWVGSPNILGSPDTAAMFYRSTVEHSGYREPLYERAPGHCCCGQAHCHAPGAGLNVYDSYQDVYERLGHRNPHLMTSEHQSKPKKSVRIQLPQDQTVPVTEDSETLRRRQYRVGLNIFNTNPKRGVEYLCKKDFLENNPTAVAKFLLGRKGLSKKMLGEYICDLQKPFNMSVLQHFVSEIDFSGLHLDIALRQLLSEVSIPGEAQKIEKLVEVFAKRYIECNHMFVSSFKSADAIFILSYAMVLLNTDLHNKSIKPERKMKQDDFLRNLRGVDCGADIDTEMLRGIYDRIKSSEFKPGSDHVTQVTKVQETMVGAKRPELNAAWRRLVCFCRVTEVGDINKKEKKDSHQRGLFLFNDLLVVTKAEKSKKKQLHQHRYSLVLSDLKVCEFRTQHFPFGVQLQERHTARIVASFACRSYNDQQRFLADIQESVAEVGEMERARIFINDIESMC